MIGLLTILGYSLYDTVVVFDKVDENTKGITGGSRHTYSEAANLALNQTLVRSVNTSIIALLPIGSILFIASFLLGAGTLKDLSLALFVGVAAGTYSSIFIATPLLADFKEREPAMAALRKRVQARRGERREGAERAHPSGRPSPQALASGPAAPVGARDPARAPIPARPRPAGRRCRCPRHRHRYRTARAWRRPTRTATRARPSRPPPPAGPGPDRPRCAPNQRRGPRPRPSGRKRR